MCALTEVTHYILNTTINGKAPTSIEIPVSHDVQLIESSAHTLPFSGTFSLSLNTFKGKYSVYAGAARGITTRVDATHNDTFLVMAANAFGVKDFSNLLTPGQFIQVGDQEFRVCLNEDVSFEAKYGNLTATKIGICDLATGYSPVTFDAGYAGATRKDLPLYVLDTHIGGVENMKIGAYELIIIDPDTDNKVLAALNKGDWIAVGHPTDGEVFRVRETTSNTIKLGTVEDYTVPASVSINSAKHATYEVQLVEINGNYTSNDGYRLRFGPNHGVSGKGVSDTTFVTTAGSSGVQEGYGCISFLHSFNYPFRSLELPLQLYFLSF